MPNATDVREKARNIIAEALGYDDEIVTDEKKLGADLGADSLDEVELVVELEKAFDINIDDDAAHRMITVGDVLGYVVERTTLG